MNQFIYSLLLLGLFSIDGQANTFCEDNTANFSNELSQSFSNKKWIKGWGPKRAVLQLSPDLKKCFAEAGIPWQQKRVLAAAEYWIAQKLNYCHHYLPHYATSISLRNSAAKGGGYCSNAIDIMLGSVYYQQKTRWNYSGEGTETLNIWQENKRWYGMDCSNYTTFLYNFAFGILFSSKISAQAGQRDDNTQLNLSPNEQTRDNLLDNPHAAGRLVCRDNTLEENHSCQNHGGYLSIFDNKGKKDTESISSAKLADLPLQPGDLLFIAANGQNSLTPARVTHVVMWLGRQVGRGVNNISPNQIAPNSLCPQKDWFPQYGDWVITDSHYQGPDYRILTPCFYLNNLWGVRRVLY